MKVKEYGNIRLYNGDCMELMEGKPENYWDLAICDPPYGIGASGDKRFGQKTPKAGSARKKYKQKNWDKNIPTNNYFNKLFNTTDNQIIWGANYFGIQGGRLFWHKNQTSYTSSNGELAYLSMYNGVHYFYSLWHGAYQENMKDKQQRIHPTEKPIRLYRWLLQNYANEGDRILDTHGGSLSLAIACEIEGFELDIIELDEDYYNAAVKRFEEHISQKELF